MEWTNFLKGAISERNILIVIHIKHSQELKVDSQSFEKAIEPLWKKNNSKEEIKPYSIFVATPVHSECSIHYTQALLEFQQE